MLTIIPLAATGLALTVPAESTNFEQDVIAAVERYDMFAPGDRVLVALSGGQDSLALLHCLNGLQDKWDLSLMAAHVHHGMRGSQADADVEFVSGFCEGLDIPIFVKRVSVPELARERGVSLEQAGRCARYDFLNETADREQCRKIALGHTATDRAETVLMNILRGAGLEGLRGIRPMRGRIVRPLIAITRRQTAHYCANHGLQPRLDRTNLDTDTYLRNRIRLELLPTLEREYAQGAERALLRLAEMAEQELAWTRRHVKGAFEAAADVHDDRIDLYLAELQEMPPGLLARILRMALRQLHGSLTGFSMRNIVDLQDLVTASETGSEVHLPFAIRARRGYNVVTLAAAESGTGREAEDWMVRLPIPGERRLPFGGQITAQLRPPPEDIQATPDDEAYLDADEVPEALVVRNWRHGERILPLGMQGSKKLQDLFVDAKVPQMERNRVPIVLDHRQRVLWVAGLRLSRLAAIRPETKQCVHLVWVNTT